MQKNFSYPELKYRVTKNDKNSHFLLPDSQFYLLKIEDDCRKTTPARS